MKEQIKILCTLLTAVIFISMFVAEAVSLIIGNTEAFQTVVLGYIALRDLLFLGLITRDAVIEVKKKRSKKSLAALRRVKTRSE